MSDTPQRLILAISGASGVIYGIRMLQILQETPIETHLVISKSAEITITYETDWKAADVKSWPMCLSGRRYRRSDLLR